MGWGFIVLIVIIIKYLLLAIIFLLIRKRVKNFNMIDFINGFRLNQEKIKDFNKPK